jgi:hypothetical protein
MYDTNKGLQQYFDERCFHVPVQLKRLKKTNVVWTNPNAKALDPNYQIALKYYDNYESYLVKTCSYILADALNPSVSTYVSDTDFVSGFADRYGGIGIGYNGGSGRNTRIHQYFVKGSGRTRLVSPLTDLSHASGGAFLEEAIREAIYSEIVRQLFPYSAVPILAIIDTGIDQVWPPHIVPNVERRVLVVRPLFLRPAHFERAAGFVTDNHLEGAIDQMRVAATFSMYSKLNGSNSLEHEFESFAGKWAHQLAFGFVHRLPMGNNTTSNISLDGRLLDFGAMSAVPTWGRFVVSKNPDSFDAVISAASAGISSIAYYLGRHLNAKFLEKHFVQNVIEQFKSKIWDLTTVEFLKLIGLAPKEFSREHQGHCFTNITAKLKSYVATQQMQISQIEAYSQTYNSPLNQFWEEESPRELRDLKNSVVKQFDVSDLLRASKRAIILQRSGIEKAALRDTIFKLLESIPNEESISLKVAVSDLIDSHIRANLVVQPKTE